jgi:7-keto-8-aminopelargonate synthetase-like enzyme
MTARIHAANRAADATAPPIEHLASTLRKQGLGRVFDFFTRTYPDLLLKELNVKALGPGRSMEALGLQLVNFGSDSFLGLDQDARVQEALVRGVATWGTHNGASRAFASVEANVEAEERLANWLGTEAVVMYPSVTLANHGAIPGLVGKADVIVADEQAHNSIHEATKIARGNSVRTATFGYCDPDDLARTLAKMKPYRFALIAVDGVYSMTGTLPPLAELAAVTRANDGVLYVDDAHGTGVLGARGRGTVLDALGSYDNTLVVGSLSKAFSCLGAFIGCDSNMAQLLKFRSNTYIFGGPVPPPYLEAILTVLDILKSDEYEALQRRLQSNVERLVQGLNAEGLIAAGGLTPIISVRVGDEVETLRAGYELFQRGYYVQSVIFPAVPYHEGVLRIQVNANHTPEMIDGLLAALNGTRRVIAFPTILSMPSESRHLKCA